MMREAVATARRFVGHTSPNPPVGAVIVRGGAIIARAAHERAGGPHAEAAAIAQLDPRLASGATLYVTLEPCTHHGRTPPCTDAILRAGIARVVIGTHDANPRVQGGGIERLRNHGVEVVVGVEHAACLDLTRPFFHHVARRMPWVHMKVAMTHDGSVGPRDAVTPEDRVITGPAARRDVHRMRFEHDAVLTGTGTVIADNPRLTVRDYVPDVTPRPTPMLRAVLDARLDTPPTARIVAPATTHAGTSTTIFYTCAPQDSPRADALRARGAEVVTVATDTAQRPDLVTVLRDLAERDCVSVMVEAGPTLNTALLRAKLVNELTLFIAPYDAPYTDAIPFLHDLSLAPNHETAVDHTLIGPDARLRFLLDADAAERGTR